jgi:hypothetical protein
MLLAGVLFLVSFCLTPRCIALTLTRLQKIVLAVACFSGLIVATAVRSDLSTPLWEQSVTLNEISDWIPVAPSLYFYLSGPPVGFSQYLHEQDHEANLPWGRYTFASIYRFLSKLGLARSVPFHQDFYSTPEPINTCTYLRELHSDFGAIGIFLVPFLMGMAGGLLFKMRENLVALMLLTFLHVVILFSFTNLVSTTGQWFQGLVVSMTAGLFLERKFRLGHQRQPMAMTSRVTL